MEGSGQLLHPPAVYSAVWKYYGTEASTVIQSEMKVCGGPGLAGDIAFQHLVTD
jgi:hypothetical protein